MLECVSQMEKAMTFTGYDANGIARVYAEHDNYDVAQTMCRDEALSYVKRRRDTGPLSQWSFTSNQKRVVDR